MNKFQMKWIEEVENNEKKLRIRQLLMKEKKKQEQHPFYY